MMTATHPNALWLAELYEGVNRQFASKCSSTIRSRRSVACRPTS